MRRKFLLWLMKTSLYSWIVLKIVPFIRFSLYYTKFRGNKYHLGYHYLKKGMMINTIDYSKLTGLIIPNVTGGISSHSAFCIAKRDPNVPDALYSYINPDPQHGEGLEVVEMTHLDFTFSDFFDLCKESERVIIYKCDDWDDFHIERMVKKALSFRDAKYDAQFSHGLKSLYCSELIYWADKEAGNGTPRLKADISDLMGLGMPYISPDGLLTADNITVVWDSKNEFTGMSGKEIAKIIFKESK